jgi:hypothetical protein
MSSLEDNAVVIPTLNYYAGYKAAPPGEHAKSLHAHLPTTYPPPPLQVEPANTSTQTKEFRRKSRIHFAALCWCLFLEGWNDGAPGPLLPALQQAYHVPFSYNAIVVGNLAQGFYFIF